MPKSKNTKVSFLFRYFLFNYWADPKKRNMEKCASQLWESRNAFVYFCPDLILSCWSHTVNRKLCTFQILSELSSLWTYQIMYWSGNAGVNIGMHMLCKRSQLYNVETFSTYEIYFRSFFRFFPKLFHFFHPIYFFSNPDKWSVYASAAHFFIIC